MRNKSCNNIKAFVRVIDRCRSQEADRQALNCVQIKDGKIVVCNGRVGFIFKPAASDIFEKLRRNLPNLCPQEKDDGSILLVPEKWKGVDIRYPDVARVMPDPSGARTADGLFDLSLIGPFVKDLKDIGVLGRVPNRGDFIQGENKLSAAARYGLCTVDGVPVEYGMVLMPIRQEDEDRSSWIDFFQSVTGKSSEQKPESEPVPEPEPEPESEPVPEPKPEQKPEPEPEHKEPEPEREPEQFNRGERPLEY